MIPNNKIKDTSSPSRLNRRLSFLTTLAVFSFLVFPQFTPTAIAQDTDYDVVVIAGTPAGVAAAIAAGRTGKSVIIIEQSPVLGGMLASGVLRLDDHIRHANSGVMEEFRQRVKAYHWTALADAPLVKAHKQQLTNLTWNVAEGQAWEPHTAARIYAEMVAEVPTIATRFNEVAVDVKMEGDRVVGVITQDRDNRGKLGSKHEYSGRVFIDATYSADLAAFAGVPFRIGREARSREEPHAGHIYTDAHSSKRGVLRGTIFPGGTGEADNRTQAFTFRMTGKDYGRPDHPYRMKKPPPDYNPAKYKWNANQKPIIPNGKFDMLGINYGADLTRHSTDFVLADWKERSEIEEIFRNHSLGWMYYIQTEGGSPNVGLADDEFMDNGNFPYRLYVRQGRRIEGLYTLTESDLHKDLRGNGIRGPVHPESIAIGMYPIDAHNVQGPTRPDAGPYGEGAAEGGVHLEDVTGPYTIPYGVMVPRNHKGLLFPVGISSTHLAIWSVRMEPPWSSLGEAAGVAAALSLDSGHELSELAVSDIQDELLKYGNMLFFYKDLPADAPEFEAVQKLSLLGAVDGDENYYFRPGNPITMGKFARMVVMGLDIPISITAAHFKDVPRGHPAFKYMETLYDYSTQSTEPFFDYEIRNYLSYWWQNQSGHGPPVFAYPDNGVTGEKATRIISGLLKKSVPAWQNPDANLTRGEAARLIYHHVKPKVEMMPTEALAEDKEQFLDPELEMAIIKQLNHEDRLVNRQPVLSKAEKGINGGNDISGEWLGFTTMFLNGPTGRGIIHMHLKQDGDRITGSLDQLKHPFDSLGTTRAVDEGVGRANMEGELIRHSVNSMAVLHRNNIHTNFRAIFTMTIDGEGRTAIGQLVNSIGVYGTMFMMKREALGDYRHLVTEEGRKLHYADRPKNIGQLEAIFSEEQMEKARKWYWSSDKAPRDGKISFEEFPHADWHRANLNDDEFLTWEEELINRAMKYISAESYLKKHGTSKKTEWTSEYDWNKDRPGFEWIFPVVDRNYDRMISIAEYKAFIKQKKKYNEPR